MWLARRHARAAAQDHLVAHELAVVLAERARRRGESRGRARRRSRSTPRRRRTAGAGCAVADAARAGERVQRAALEEVAASTGAPRRGESPTRPRWAAGAGPAGVGVGLVVADVADRRVGSTARSPARVNCASRRRPVRAPSRAAPSSRCARTASQPSESQSSGARVAAVVDEGQVLAVGDEPRGERERLDEDAVARRLVVEGEAVAVVPDLDAAPPAKRDPASSGAALAGARRGRACGRGRRAAAGCSEAACLMSVRISSWCCCSWCRPSSIASAAPRRRARPRALEQRVHRARRRGAR